MKFKHLAVITALSTFTIIGCDSNKDDETTVTTTENQVENEAAAVENPTVTTGTVAEAEVPNEVRTTFTTKYPTAKTVTWTRYKPVADDGLDINETYYYVRFNNDGADYINWYNTKGEWVKTSTLVANESGLPAPVNKYIKDNYADYTIEEINKENDKDRDMYEIKLNKGEDKVKLKILPNGEVFKQK